MSFVSLWLVDLLLIFELYFRDCLRVILGFSLTFRGSLGLGPNLDSFVSLSLSSFLGFGLGWL